MSDGTFFVQMRLSHLTLLPSATFAGMIRHLVKVTDSGTINEASHSVPQSSKAQTQDGHGERVIGLQPAEVEKAVALVGKEEKGELVLDTQEV